MSTAVAVGRSVGPAREQMRWFAFAGVVLVAATYTIVTGALIATYAVLVTQIPRVLPVSSNLAVGTATLAAAGIARSLLQRAQTVIDRRFNRSHDDELTVNEFGVQLRREVEPEAVTRELIEVVHRSIQPTSVRLWRP